MTPNIRRFEIDPLTKKATNGQTYFRREVTVAQLIELQTSPDGEIERRVKVEREEEDGSLKSEALVFLFRTYMLVDPVLADTIFSTLTLRIRRIVRQFEYQLIVREDFNDFTQDLNMEVLRKIGRLDSNAADYAQASFGQWVLQMATNLKRVYETANKIHRVVDSLDAPADDEVSRAPIINIEDMNIPADMKLLVKEALEVIKGSKGDAWLMRLEGWQIGSKDPEEPTIARYFNVSDRTIRNWIADVDEDLRNWREARS